MSKGMLYEGVVVFSFILRLVSFLNFNSDDRRNRMAHRGIPFGVVG